ncbi:MAG: sn-glycerol-3-phosphate ABC transporter permease UgpE, partial [Alphaproteobacteria bacterium]|nr:sn-glycerol-3-phosphate ABC transporter permease UgpE [Alphaproteobacteria bacterium]
TTATGGSIAITAVAMMMFHSFCESPVPIIMALCIAAGKIAISLLSAFAVVYFRFPGRMLAFWLIFVTLMLPVEVRIIPTFQVMVDLSLTNSRAGLIVPLMASATATLLFRQFFLTIPREYVEAAKVDGAGPLRFFRDVVLPLSVTNIAALFVILFIYGWNQYLWPLLIINERSLETIVVGLTKMIGTGDSQNEWNIIMATAVMAMLPPVAVVVLMQRWFIKGLTETEK